MVRSKSNLEEYTRINQSCFDCSFVSSLLQMGAKESTVEKLYMRSIDSLIVCSWMCIEDMNRNNIRVLYDRNYS